VADQIEFSEGIQTVEDWTVPIVSEAGFGGPLNAYKLMNSLIQAGASCTHCKDEPASEKQGVHPGGQVLIPTLGEPLHALSRTGGIRRMTSNNAYRQTWDFKESSMQYVETATDHDFELADGVERSSERFHFRFELTAQEQDWRGVVFSGSVMSQAHQGILFIPLRNPVIETSGNEVVLHVVTVRVSGLDIFHQVFLDSVEQSSTYESHLLGEGVHHFGDGYPGGNDIGSTRVQPQTAGAHA
jgi:hypothetical protein